MQNNITAITKKNVSHPSVKCGIYQEIRQCLLFSSFSAALGITQECREVYPNIRVGIEIEELLEDLHCRISNSFNSDQRGTQREEPYGSGIGGFGIWFLGKRRSVEVRLNWRLVEREGMTVGKRETEEPGSTSLVVKNEGCWVIQEGLVCLFCVLWVLGTWVCLSSHVCYFVLTNRFAHI